MAVWAALGAPIPSAWATTILLKDQTTLDAQILRIDDDHVIIGLPRENVVTVNGTALPPALGEGVQAPAFSVHDLQGAVQTVGKDHGKVTVLHFWISWCPHCRSDAPKMQALYTKFRDNPNVRIVTVNLDEQRAPIDQFIKKFQVTYPVIDASAQAAISGQANVPELYQITGFPMTFLIDQHGIIRHKFSGSFAEAGKDPEPLVHVMLAAAPPVKNPVRAKTQ